jgi:hypothetical protein
MKLADRNKLWARLNFVLTPIALQNCFPDIIKEIDRAVRRARREARSEATTCVDCRVVLLAEVPLCEACVSERDKWGIDRDSRKRFYADAAKRQEDRECEEAADMADVRGARR